MNPCIGMACFISKLLHFQISGIQKRQLISHQLMCSLCPSHSWLILQGTCAQMQCLLALTPRPESQPGTIITRQCPNGGITLLFFESKERHFVICLPGMLVFSPTLKNYQKPLVINTNCPLLNSVQHSRKAVFLCQIT